MAPFCNGEIDEGELTAMAVAAYAGFDHPAIAPLVQLDDTTIFWNCFMVQQSLSKIMQCSFWLAPLIVLCQKKTACCYFRGDER